MGDRRPSLFSRFLASTAPSSRRAPPAQTTVSAPPAQTPAKPRARTSDTLPSPSLANAPSTIQSTTSTTPPNSESKTPIRRPAATSDTSTPSILPKPNSSTVNQTDAKAPPSSNEPQKVDRSTFATSSRLANEPNKQVPSNRSTQSRSPPLSSSPSPASPQVRSMPPSPSRVGTVTTPSIPPKASPIRPQSNVSSRSPKTTSSPATIASETKSSSRELLTKSRSLKGTESPSTSKEPRRQNQDTSNTNREPTYSANTKGPKPVEPQHLLAEVNGKNKPQTEQKQNLDVEKDVQKLVQMKNSESSESNEKKKANNFHTKISDHEAQATEKAEIPRTRNHISINDESAPETKEILSTPLLKKNPFNTKTHETPNKRILNANHHDHLSLHSDIKNGLSKFSNQMSIPDLKSDNNPSVITLAGENRGAVMHIGSNASLREGPIHIHRGYKLISEAVTSDGDHRSVEGNKLEDAKGIETDQPPEAAYVNNNSQGLNNSIVLSSSFSERDPGVHIVITKETIRPRDGIGHGEMRKVEYNTSSANKLAYSKPVVKRRCLRGMLLDSSDSDPEKPRRHGCRVTVKE